MNKGWLELESDPGKYQNKLRFLPYLSSLVVYNIELF